MEKAIREAAQAHQPAIAMAAWIDSKKQRHTASVSIDELDVDQGIGLLVSLKHAYLELCQQLAQIVGVPEQDIHNRVAELMNAAKFTETRREGGGSVNRGDS